MASFSCSEPALAIAFAVSVMISVWLFKLPSALRMAILVPLLVSM